MEKPDWQKMMLTGLVLIAVIIAAISVMLVMRYRRPEKDKAAILYRQFTEKAGLDPYLGETPLAYAARLGRISLSVSEAADELTANYLAARYGPPSELRMSQLQQSVQQFAP